MSISGADSSVELNSCFQCNWNSCPGRRAALSARLFKALKYRMGASSLIQAKDFINWSWTFSSTFKLRLMLSLYLWSLFLGRAYWQRCSLSPDSVLSYSCHQHIPWWGIPELGSSFEKRYLAGRLIRFFSCFGLKPLPVLEWQDADRNSLIQNLQT